MFLFICFYLTLKSLMLLTDIILHRTIHGSSQGQGVLDWVPQKSGPKTKWECFIGKYDPRRRNERWGSEEGKKGEPIQTRLPELAVAMVVQSLTASRRALESTSQDSYWRRTAGSSYLCAPVSHQSKQLQITRECSEGFLTPRLYHMVGLQRREGLPGHD